MKNNKFFLFFGFTLFLCLSLQAQESIQNLNALLGQARNTPSQSLRQTSSPSIELLKKDFFEARGIMSVVNSTEAVKWERADKPLEVFQVKSMSEINVLRNSYEELFPEIQTIILELGETELSDNINDLALLTSDMPNLRNILITSQAAIPNRIDQYLSSFINTLNTNQSSLVNVYYYQAPQPK